MKIEIELSEIEGLKQELYDERSRRMDAEKAYKEIKESVNPVELRRKALILSQQMFTALTSAVFEKLGFEYSYGYRSQNIDTIDKYLGDKNINWDDLKNHITADISAEVGSQFKRVFLNIGILTPEDIQKTKDYLEL